MKSLIALLVIVFFSPTAQADRVFSESLLKTWGYKTSKVGKTHSIRSLKNYGDSKEAFYARFGVSKSSYGSPEEAAKKKKELDSTRKNKPAGSKDYTQIIQDGVDLYFIRATSNYTRLSHQPKLMKLVKAHLKKKNSNRVPMAD